MNKGTAAATFETFEISITKQGEAFPFWTKRVATHEEAAHIASLNQRLIDRYKWDHTVSIRPTNGEESS